MYPQRFFLLFFLAPLGLALPLPPSRSLPRTVFLVFLLLLFLLFLVPILVLRWGICIVCINGLEKGLKSSLGKFADDNKAGRQAPTTANYETIIKIETYEMSFTFDKCKVLHFRTRNSDLIYSTHGKLLQIWQEESDLIVVLRRDAKIKRKTNNKTSTLIANSEPGVMELILIRIIQ